jgi:hypothetical protein
MIARVKHWLAWLAEKCHRAQHYAHLAYFGAVALETSYWYSAIAGGLLVVGIIAILEGFDNE